MTFAQLRTFVVLAATGSVHAAAKELNVSQPAVSAAVGALQKDLGVKLVSRDGRGLQLTAEGTTFAGYARKLLGLLDEGRKALRSSTDPEHGHVRLAAVTTAGEHVLPRALATFRSRYPGAEISLEVGNRDRVWDLMEHREADVAIGGRPPGRSFRTLATRPNRLVVVARSRLDGVRLRCVEVDELARQTFLLREPGSGTRSTAEEFLDDLRISPPTLTVGSNGSIKESVLVGLGVTLISYDAVARDLEEGSLEQWQCDGLPLDRAWHLVARANEDLPATAALFVEHLTAAGNTGGSSEGFTLVGPAES